MTFSDAEKAAIVSIWGKVSGNENAVCAEALERMFQNSPQTKTYSRDFDLSRRSADLQTHGGKVLGVIGEAASNPDKLEVPVAELIKLRVDPGNFRLLADSILGVLTDRFPEDFNAPVRAAWDKFSVRVSLALTSK